MSRRKQSVESSDEEQSNESSNEGQINESSEEENQQNYFDWVDQFKDQLAEAFHVYFDNGPYEETFKATLHRLCNDLDIWERKNKMPKL
jgi:hypothetical protein